MNKLFPILIICISFTVAQVSAENATIPHGQIKTDQILKIFWERVDEGKIVLFNTTVKWDILKPIAVRVTQPLEDTIPTVSVLSEVGGKIYYPGMGELMRISNIEVVLGPSGQVVHIKKSASSKRQ